MLAAAFAAIVLWAPAAPVAACSGATVSFESIRTGAERIVVATIVAVDTADAVPTRVTLAVQQVLRGVSGPEIVLEPPTFMGCGGQMDEPIGARLVVATGPHYFSASPPEELHPYWRVLPGDVVEPAGVDDPDPDHSRLGGLVADLGGGLPGASIEPEAVVEPPSSPDTSAGLAVAIVVVTFLAAAVLFGSVVAAARGRRGKS
jgi:hypothetical protein